MNTSNTTEAKALRNESARHLTTSCSLCRKTMSVDSSVQPALRASPFPEVTDLACRLPLSTLLYRPEAVNLGDLMRIWVRSGVQIKRFPSDFQGLSRAHRIPCKQGTLPARIPHLQITCFRGTIAQLRSKENTSQGSRQRVRFHLCCHTLSTARLRNINLIPFRETKQSFNLQIKGLTRPSGSTNPCPNSVHMEPFSTSAFKILI